MKSSLTYKITALILVCFFSFQSMSKINTHTYTTGVDNIHIHYGGCLFSQISMHASYHCTN
ncbi:hypothetical protein [Lacinutrix undariae]